MTAVLVADLGGTRLRAAVVGAGKVLARQAVSTPQDDPGALASLIRSVLAEAPEPVAGVVVGVPGPIDYQRGLVLRLPNIPLWEGKVSAAGLSAELGREVLLANDADLATLGEHAFGAGQGFEDMVYMTCSTGVGAGVVIGGRLLRGRLSLAEAGHTIIDLQSGQTLEELGSGTALRKATGEHGKQTLSRIEDGDAEALAQFSRVARAFAVGVFNMVHVFSPQAVVIGGGMSQAGELLLTPARELLDRCQAGCPGRDVQLLRAAGGDDVGLLGGYAYWLSEAPGR